MPDPRGYLLSPEFADDVRETVDIVLSDYRNDPPRGPRRPAPSAQNSQRLRVTSDDPGDVETVAGVDYYPAVPVAWSVTDGDYADLFPDATVKVFDPAGGSLAEDDQVEARQVADDDFSGETWPVFAVLSGGGGDGEEVVRISNAGWYVKDDASRTTCSGGPSPWCYYPGNIVTIDCGNVIVGQAVWVVFWYTQGAVPPTAAGRPSTVVKCDGTVAHKAKYMGFSYAPDNLGVPEVHPNAGDPRPVYLSTEGAAGYFVNCDTDTPRLTLFG